MDDKIKRYGIVVLLFGLVLTACGNQMNKNITDYSSGETEAQAVKLEAWDADSEQRGVRWFRLTGNEEVEAWDAEEINEIAYSDEEIHVSYTDDLSLLDQMGQTDFRYAARDGKVYYRQYHYQIIRQ